MSRPNTCEYDLTTYSHQQLWTLVRDLSADGWEVAIRVKESRRRQDHPLPTNHVEVCVWNRDEHHIGYRSADTPWKAIKKAVKEVVMPFYTGDATDGN